MNAIDMIKGRRSVRKYKAEKVSRELMTEIVELASWAPSWGNLQVARYTLVDNPEIIEQFAQNGMRGFAYNINTLKTAPGVAVLSFVKGKSGKVEAYGYKTEANAWETFDAGIACQTFCLAAHEKGVGTCIFGLFDNEATAKLVNLPEDETIAALIVYGYEDGETAPVTRKDVTEIMRFVG